MTQCVKPVAAMLLAICLVSAVHAQPGPLTEVRALTAEGHYEEALQRLGAYLTEHPDDVEARLFEGVVYTRQGRTEEAIAAFRKLALERPEMAEPYNNLAVLYAADGRYEEARDALLSAVDRQPDYATAQENLGDVYAKLASLAYEKAYTLNEGNTRVRDKAGLLAQALSSAPSPTATKAPEAPSPPAVAIRDEETCLKFTGYEENGARDAIVAWLGERGVQAREQTKQNQLAPRYKVYMSPLVDAQAANAEVARMKVEGVQDIVRISYGELQNGISFGVYSSEERARRRVAQLAAKGFESQYKALTRSGTVRWLETRAAAAALDEAALARTFPFVSSERTACQ